MMSVSTQEMRTALSRIGFMDYHKKFKKSQTEAYVDNSGILIVIISQYHAPMHMDWIIRTHAELDNCIREIKLLAE